MKRLSCHNCVPLERAHSDCQYPYTGGLVSPCYKLQFARRTPDLPIHHPPFSAAESIRRRQQAHISRRRVSVMALLATFESSQPGLEAQRGKSKSALGGPQITGESLHGEEGPRKLCKFRRRIARRPGTEFKESQCQAVSLSFDSLIVLFFSQSPVYLVFIANSDIIASE